MISEESITQISHLFCGDTEGYYLYKTGPKLVAFFNQYLGSNDIYKSGFPSRWVYVFQSIEQSFRDVCGRSFEANDPFASFAVRVIKDEFSFVVKEIAATMLRYVAWDVNRFSVQHMVRDLLLSDLDPMLKDIIKE